MITPKKLIITTYLLGLIPLVVGLSIFFSWWIGKAWFLTTFYELEKLGFRWVLISILLGLAGLFTWMAYVVKSKKSGYTGLLCVLINAPALMWVLDKQADIEQRAYVRVYNNSGFDFKAFTISNSLYTESLDFLGKDDYQTGYFYPNYDEWDSGAPEIEKVILTINTDKGERTISMPTIYKGDCVELLLDTEFAIELMGQ